MKRILIVTAILGVSILSAFSQTGKSLKIDTTSQNLSIFKYSKPDLWGGNTDVTNIFKGNNKANNQSFNYFAKPEKSHMITIYDLESNDPMPCIKPKGYFSMRIYKPDTRYVLLNK